MRMCSSALAQAKTAVPDAPQAWPMHVDNTAAEVAASLLHPAVVTPWTMHAACGRTQWEQTDWDLESVCVCPWTVALEQLVHIGPRQTKRADLLVTTTGGTAFALDLTFSATQVDHGPPGAHLHRCNAAKASRYNTTPGGALPRRAQLVPVTYAASRPFLHSNGVHRLYRAVTATAALTCIQDSPAWSFHLSAATSECASCLGCVFATWLWRQAFTCCLW